MSVTRSILQRTFNIRYEGSTATCFTVDVGGRRYLVTARHVVDTIQGEAAAEISYNRRWHASGVRLVGHGPDDIDVSVLAPQELFGAAHPLRLTLTTAGLPLAGDAYFLGFPFGLGMNVQTALNAGFPLPFVKKAIVTAIGLGDEPILLDGHNNAGFSGGPVVRPWNNNEQIVIGVVSGYRPDRSRVRDADGNETPFTYDTNTGIIIAHDIRHALALIEANPVGIPVSAPTSD